VPTVKIVAEEDGPGYWLADAEARRFGTLPVAAELRDRLAAWNDWFSADCDAAALADPTAGRFDVIAFSNQGFRLAKAVKRALPDWTVLYWDEALDWRYWTGREPRRYDRGSVEYEITRDIALTAD
jgi:hypothetical protein